MGQFPPSPLVVAVALPDRSTQLHETEEPLVTRPRQDPTLANEREILGGFCAAGETGVLGYGDSPYAIDSGRSQGVEVTPQALL